jgi:hypothetical protein
MVVKMNQYEERILIQGHTNPSIKEKLWILNEYS